MEVRYVSGKPYEKELSANEERFLAALQATGFEFALIRHEHYQPVYRIQKNGISLDYKFYTDPKIRVEDQFLFFGRLFNLTAKVEGGKKP